MFPGRATTSPSSSTTVSPASPAAARRTSSGALGPTATWTIPARSRRSMNTIPPRSRRRCTHPPSRTRCPTCCARSSPQRCVRLDVRLRLSMLPPLRTRPGRVLPGRVRSGGNIDNLSRTSRRTHRCGELRAQHVGQRVRLGGWVHRRRDLGGIVFIDLRDRAGIVQVAVGPSAPEDVRRAAAGLAGETVVELEGEVVARPGNMRNPELATGEVEVHPSKLAVVGPAVTPAIPLARAKVEELPTEELRLKYRHLDLRRPEMQANLVLRHRLLQRARRTLAELEFLEIETPILTKPTPEGARDYLVPSRVHPGEFYALPQSPQIYKQLLMVAGFDRYFQIARCFRDEDLRND